MRRALPRVVCVLAVSPSNMVRAMSGQRIEWALSVNSSLGMYGPMAKDLSSVTRQASTQMKDVCITLCGEI